MQFFAGVEPKRVPSPGAFFAEQKACEVDAVDLIGRQGSADPAREADEQIHGCDKLVSHPAPRDVSGPPNGARYLHAAVEGGELALAQRTRRPGVFAVGKKRPIIGGEYHEGPLFKSMLSE